MTFNAFKIWHVLGDYAATDCVDSGIGFFHGKVVEDYAYGRFRETVWAKFDGHAKNLERGTDSRASLSAVTVMFL